MKRSNMPKMDIGSRPNVRADVTTEAINRWMPDLRAADSGGAEITILDAIGADFWGEGVTAKRVAGALRAIGDRDVVVTINSPGGDVFEGVAIYNLLREHKGEVTVKILGLAASAASIVAMAGDRIEIGAAASIMIHNSWVLAAGDRLQMREIADWLEPFDQGMAEVYAMRTGVDVDQIGAMMDAETWVQGRAAVDQGFADDLLSSDQVSIDGSDPQAKSLRAERKFDLVAARAGLSRADGRDLLRDVKGGKPGAALTDEPGAVEIRQGLEEILASFKT